MHHRQTLHVPMAHLFRQCNASCRCSRYVPLPALLDLDFEAPELKPASKYTSTTNVLMRLRAYRSQAGRRPTRAGGRRGAQAAPRTPGTVGSALLCSAACARRCLRATTCPPHVRRLRASLACLPAAAGPTASAFGSGRGRRAAVHGLGDSLWFASCRKYLLWDSCHAMNAVADARDGRMGGVLASASLLIPPHSVTASPFSHCFPLWF